MTAQTAAAEIRRAVRVGVTITSLIGAAAAFYSFNDALFVVRRAGTTGGLAYIPPLFADGLIALCSAALYAHSRASRRRPAWPSAGVIIGIAVTVVMNVAAGLAHSWADALIDALAPVVFLIALEVLVGQFRLTRPGPAADRPRQCPHGVPSSFEEAVRLDYEHRRDCLGERPSNVQHGQRWGVDRRRVPELVGAALNGDGPHG